MNLFRTYLIAFIFIASCTFANGQGMPKAVLVDEFGTIPCEDLKARTDSFITELNENPNDLGYVVVSRRSNSTEETRPIIRANLYTRQFPRDRFIFRLASNPESAVSQFWRVPPGAEAPVSEAFEEEHRNLSRAFRFARSERHDLAGICPTFSPADFSDLILANPGSKARLVILGPSKSSRRSAAYSELEVFARYTGLPRKRIQLYYVHRPDLSYTITEYWFISAK
ncbi:MAG TPA: hypothetical protein PKD26_09875 [Pyrinomonadaceae bacterium]|nr:hypothetical protein [Pyrinomonadaceae bacterium]